MDSFQENLNYYRNLEIIKRRLSNRVSLLRLLVFAAGFLLTVYIAGEGHKSRAFIVALIIGALFVFIVVKHDAIIREIAEIKSRIIINEKYILRAKDGWQNFEDSGQEYIDSKHQYTSDLDIFGKGSLFQWINVAHTYFGRNSLKQLLSTKENSISTIVDRQKAINELGCLNTFCEELECHGLLAKGIEKDPQNLIAYSVKSDKLISSKIGYYALYIIPLFTFASIVLYIIRGAVSWRFIVALLLLQMLITAIGSLKVNSILNTVSPFKQSIIAYSGILKLIENEEFKSKYLKDIKSRLNIKNKPSSSAIKKLQKISDRIDMRNNVAAYVLLNSLLLWDFHCVIALEEWRLNYGARIEEWLKCIGEFEALSSLSVICRLNKNWTFPELYNDGLEICAKGLGHPLINPEKRVCNDVCVNNNISIITGSNMSGKTTLLRTIGISLVLAYAGAPVYAKSFRCSVMEIFTSMRIEDDLNSGISTFYAELLRVKKIIEFSKERKSMLFLIDEIFKGTNSRDRLTGAVSLIKNLNREWIIGLISTHDFELCDLENNDKDKITNYHFSESYTNDEIIFDYKLKKGRCVTTNAKYLMRMVGIDIDE